jgi:cell division protein FtsZ
MMQFEIPTERPSIIKVIGVGGGGSNAVNHMFKLGIKGVDFIVCNTDNQALDKSPVPTKIQLGPGLTQGLGAGAVPEVGKQAALENIDELKEILRHGTRMVFITAGMGGGTGTGAAPIIAATARELGILTVGIVTIPFGFEGKKRKAQADAGVEEMRKNVDTLLVVCNDKLREIYGDLKLREAFGHADDILAVAAKSIAEIITTTLHINVDFADIQTVMKESGVAIMGSAFAEGENRSAIAVERALHSPLLNDNSIEGARYILLNITSGDTEITMDEMTEITDHVQERAGHTAEVIMGVGTDETLGNKINVTVIATGFKTKDQLDTVISVEDRVTKYDISGTVINPSAINDTAPDTAINDESTAFSENSFDETLSVAEIEAGSEGDDSDGGMFLFIKDPEVPAIDEIEIQVEMLTETEIEAEVEVETEAETELPVLESAVPEELVMNIEESVADETEPFEMTFEFESDSTSAEVVNIEMSEDGVVNEIEGLTEMDLESIGDEQIMNSERSSELSLESTVVFEIKNEQIDPNTPFVFIKPQEQIEEEQPMASYIKESPAEQMASDDDAKRKAMERMNKIRQMNLNMKYNTPDGLNDMEREPAYKRRGFQFENSNSVNTEISKLSLSGDNDGKPEIKPNNPFLHDRVD